MLGPNEGTADADGLPDKLGLGVILEGKLDKVGVMEGTMDTDGSVWVDGLKLGCCEAVDGAKDGTCDGTCDDTVDGLIVLSHPHTVYI